MELLQAQFLSKRLPKNIYAQGRIAECKGCFRVYECDWPVPPAGFITAEWCFIGAAPGRQEVENNMPFYSKAPGGNMLLSYFEAFGIVRTDCYITNCCFCMGFKDRLPTALESDICANFKVREFKSLTNLKHIILLGNNAIRQFIRYDFPTVTHTLGKIYKTFINESEAYVLLLHHPGYLLRNRKVQPDVLKAIANYREVIGV